MILYTLKESEKLGYHRITTPYNNGKTQQKMLLNVMHDMLGCEACLVEEATGTSVARKKSDLLFERRYLSKK